MRVARRISVRNAKDQETNETAIETVMLYGVCETESKAPNFNAKKTEFCPNLTLSTLKFQLGIG